MSHRIKETKSDLRGKVRERLKLMNEEARVAASAQARRLLAAQPRWQKAGSLLFYAPMPMELDVWPLIEEALAAGKAVALPRFDATLDQYVACRIEHPTKDLQPGNFGIREPNAHCARSEVSRFDLMLVPGLAFDLQGRRLGRGKGYYDQLLALLSGPACGVAFEEQVVDEVPIEGHDVRLDCLLTPTQWIEFHTVG